MSTWKKIVLQATGFGACSALISAVILATLFWWNDRPKQWSDKAITAKIGELSFQERGGEMHIWPARSHMFSLSSSLLSTGTNQAGHSRWKEPGK